MANATFSGTLRVSEKHTITPKVTPSGANVLTIFASYSRKVRRGGESKTEYTNCKITVWGQKVDVMAKFVKPGDTIYVVGEPSIDTYKDKAGETKCMLAIELLDFGFVGNKGSATGSGDAGSQPQGGQGGDYSDDIPF